MSETLLNQADIRHLIPHRPPYLMLDRAELAGPTSARAVKNVSFNEPCFCGHFPGHPILPGVLQVEAISQLAVLGRAADADLEGRVPFLRGASRIKFRKPVIPGDRLDIEAAWETADDGGILVTGRTVRGGEITCEATLHIAFLDPEGLAQRTELVAPCRVEAGDDGLDVEAIMAAIPHRFPFLLIDRVLSDEADDAGQGRFVVLKNITANEPYFDGMACDTPILPNYLVAEIAAQAGCALVLSRPEFKGRIGYFMAIDRADFQRAIVPGDQLVIELTVKMTRGRFGKGTACLFIGDEEVASTDIKFAIADE